MKITKIVLTSMFVLLSITSVFAQYGNYGYGNGGGNGYGNGGGMYQMNNAMNQRSEPEKPKQILPEETVAKVMEEMKPLLNLDVLQEIAISNVFIESINTQGRILKQEISQDEKIKNFQILSENTDRKIMDFLNKDQKEKYIIFKEERKNPKKSKSKKK